MKFVYIINLLIGCALFLSGCQQNHDIVKSIVVTIDPNKKESKYQIIYITKKDSIKIFMEKFNNRKSEPVKFYPRYSIELNYTDKTEKFIGNSNHVKDANGHTYKLLAMDWEIYNY